MIHVTSYVYGSNVAATLCLAVVLLATGAITWWAMGWRDRP